jgi:hypothetical protein
MSTETEIVTVETSPKLDSSLEEPRRNLHGALIKISRVESDDEAQAATLYISHAKGWVSNVNKWFEPMVQAAHKAHKALTTRRAETIKEIESETDRVQKLVNGYLTEKQRQQRIAAAAAQEAERKRIEDARLAEAARLESVGMVESAAQVIEDAAVEVSNVTADVVSTKTVTAPIDGVSGVEVWTFAITDGALIPRQFLMPDEKAIKAYVTANKERALIPGVRVYSEVQTRIGKA